MQPTNAKATSTARPIWYTAAMQNPAIFCGFLALALPLLLQAQAVNTPAEADSKTLQAALQRASRQAGSPYSLQVHCTDQKGHRAFMLFPGGIAIWEDSTQVGLTDVERSELLAKLLRRGFAAMAPMYGSGDEADESDVAFRVSCMVSVQIDGLEKSSAQQADGPQSAELKGLAADLLDQVEPLVANGLTAADLQDGLEKLASGVLAPEAFRLRLVDLPAAGGAVTGSILRVAAGGVSRQAYAPGRELGTQSWLPLAHCRIQDLAMAIRAANLPALPANLWSGSYIELEVRVLNHAKTIIARSFARLKAKSPGEDQQRFDRLLDHLQALNPAEMAHCPK